MPRLPLGHRQPIRDVSLPDDDPRYAEIQTRIRRGHNRPEILLEVLHVVQRQFGHLPKDALRYVARCLRLPPSRVFGVATFYHMFTHEPAMAHRCTVCLGTACFMKGGKELFHVGEQVLASNPDSAARWRMRTVRCMGVCSIAPVVMYDGTMAGQQTEASVATHLAQGAKS